MTSNAFQRKYAKHAVRDSPWKFCFRKVETNLLAIIVLMALASVAFFLGFFQEAGTDGSVTGLVTVVGYHGCTNYLQCVDLVQQVVSTKKGLRKSMVELPSEESYVTWLNLRKESGVVHSEYSACPAAFIRDQSGDQMFIGGTAELARYLNDMAPGILDPDVLEQIDVAHQAALAVASRKAEREMEAQQTRLRKQKEREAKKKKQPAFWTVPPLEPQITPRMQKVVTGYRVQEGKIASNYKPLWQYFMKRGYKFFLNQPVPSTLIFVQDQTSAQAAQNKNRNAIINNIGWGGQSCYGGTKGAQMRCRMELAARDGCSYYSLKIQPPQYRFWMPDDCVDFFTNICPDDNVEDERLWIEKPSGGQHGVGMKVHRGCAKLRARHGHCKASKAKKFFAMEYLDPALIEGHKFDVRSYLVVASLDPLLVFYHDGFVRRATNPYTRDTKDNTAHITNAASQNTKDDHFWDFGRLETYLEEKLGFQPRFMRTKFREQALKVENFVFQAARRNMYRRKGTFQVFALDWIIDSAGGVHMLEANSNPLVTNYPIPGYPETWDQLMELVWAVHTNPSELGPMNVGMKGPRGTTQGSGPGGARYAFHDWQLVFNELEESAVGATYNACKAFAESQFAVDPNENLSIEDVESRLVGEEADETVLAESELVEESIEEQNAKSAVVDAEIESHDAGQGLLIDEDEEDLS